MEVERSEVTEARCIYRVEVCIFALILLDIVARKLRIMYIAAIDRECHTVIDDRVFPNYAICCTIESNGVKNML